MKNVKINDKWDLKLPEFRASALPWNHWEYGRLNAMYSAIRKGDTIVDVGAEHGDLSALYASWSGGDMILVEPSENYWPYIRDIFEANNTPAPILSFVGFASDSTSEDALVSEGFPAAIDLERIENPGFKHLNEGNAQEIALDNLCKNIKVDVLTIDVEGAEYSVIQGTKELIERDRPTIFVSIHPEFMWDRYKMTKDDLIHQFQLWGYFTTYLGKDHEEHFMFKP